MGFLLLVHWGKMTMKHKKAVCSALLQRIVYLFLKKSLGYEETMNCSDYERCSSLSLILLDPAVSVLCISISQLPLTLTTCVGGADSLSGRTLRDDSRLAPSQWETALQSNAVSHWLGVNLEAAMTLYLTCQEGHGSSQWMWERL